MLAHATAGKFEQAKVIFDHYYREAKSSDATLSSDIAIGFILACGRAGEARLAHKVHDARFRPLLQRDEMPPKVARVSLNSVISTYAREGMLEEARSVFEEVRHQADTPVVNALLMGYREKNDAQGAMALASTWFSCFDGWASGRADGGVRKTEQVNDKILTPDMYTVKLLIDVCRHQGDAHLLDAEFVYTRALAADVKLDKFVDHTMVKVLVQLEKKHQAMETYERSRKRQVFD